MKREAGHRGDLQFRVLARAHRTHVLYERVRLPKPSLAFPAVHWQSGRRLLTRPYRFVRTRPLMALRRSGGVAPRGPLIGRGGQDLLRL